MIETKEPAAANVYRALWRRLRWVYAAIIGADVVAGLVMGLSADTALFGAIFLLLVGVIVTWVGCAAHMLVGWRTAVPRRSVAIEAILGGLLAAVVGGGASLFAFGKSFEARVDRTKAVGDAVIGDVRAYRAKHGRWPATLADAGVDPARLAAGPLELKCDCPQDTSGDHAPLIRFARAPEGFGMTYRRADQDTWTVYGD